MNNEIAEFQQNRRKRSKYPRSDIRHWLGRIHKPTKGTGKAHNWAAFFTADGERHCLSLGTPNKQAAAARAKELFEFLAANGWKKTWELYRRPMAEKKADATIGEYLEAVREKCHFDNVRTLRGYETCLRRIASDISKIDDKGGRYDYVGGARDAWLSRVHAIKLSRLTPDKVQDWQVAYLRAAAPDPLSQRRVKVSCSTTIRQAKSLFSKTILDAISGVVEIPDPLPFSGLKKIERQSFKYTSQIDLQTLFEAAHAELSEAKPELFKVFLLGVTAGLRRKEIDLLPWTAFNWSSSTIEIKPAQHFAAKSEDSYGAIQMEPGIMALFRKYRSRATAEFVIESTRPAKAVRWNRYRCEPVFDALTQWLRSQGLSGNKPLHTLRKEFGSAVCNAHGVYAASRALRHGDVAVTAQFYVESRSRVTAGMSHLLPPAADKVVEFPQDVAAG